VTLEAARLPARQRFPWGPKQAGIGIALAIAVFFAGSIAVAVVVAAAGFEVETRDVPGPFEKVRDVVEYADRKLQAAATGQPLPDPPRLIADTRAIQVGLAVTFFAQALWVLIAIRMSGRGAAGFVRSVGLNRPPRPWWPIAVAFLAYVTVIGFSILVEVLDIDWLRPESTLPEAVTRDTSTLVLAGFLAVVVAPLAEETFFRGFLFSGFLRWGALAGFALSALIFSAIHTDPGSLVPFFFVGLGLAWLFYRRGVLWDAILCHFLFNAVGFSILLTRSV
jgi:membrane protease YdiL (CAAX protease family)